MYAKMVLANGCTLQQLRDDLVGLLTGSKVTAASLTSCTIASSEVVNTLAAEWSFVQHLADSATRCHFVLSGVDDGGIPKTLGCVLTSASGTLGWLFWMCGAWDSVNKRPAAIDVTGWTLASAAGTAASFAAGNVKNTVNVIGINSGSLAGPTANTGVFNTGLLQLQVSSYQGVTTIVGHWAANHTTIIETIDVPRWIGGSDMNAANFPFVQCVARSPLYSSAAPSIPVGPYRGYYSSIAAQIGLCIGASSQQTMAAPLTTELAGCASYTSSAGAPNVTVLELPVFPSIIASRWHANKSGANIITLQELVFQLAVGSMSDAPIKRRVSSYLFPAGSTTAAFTAYLDELVSGADTFVSAGITSNGSGLSIALYKG